MFFQEVNQSQLAEKAGIKVDDVVTTFDGYQMALQGRAGPALGIAAFAVAAVAGGPAE